MSLWKRRRSVTASVRSKVDRVKKRFERTDAKTLEAFVNSVAPGALYTDEAYSRCRATRRYALDRAVRGPTRTASSRSGP